MPDIIHITNWDDQALDLFARTKESSLLHPPAHGRGILPKARWWSSGRWQRATNQFPF